MFYAITAAIIIIIALAIWPDETDNKIKSDMKLFYK